MLAAMPNFYRLAFNFIGGCYAVTVDHLPRDQVRVRHMVITASALCVYARNICIPAGARPSTITLCGAVGAGTAINLATRLAAMTEAMSRAELALIPSRISTQRLR